MRTLHVVAVVAGISTLVAFTAPAATRKSHKLSCKEVHKAVWAGHTIEQLTAEFDTDAAHIMKCVTARKGKKPKPSAGQNGGAKPQANARKGK